MISCKMVSMLADLAYLQTDYYVKINFPKNIIM
jgi:hypothetical protein